MSKDILTIARIKKFARRTRDCRHGYRLMEAGIARGSQDETGFQICERMKNVRKRHRSSLDLESSFLNNV